MFSMKYICAPELFFFGAFIICSGSGASDRPEQPDRDVTVQINYMFLLWFRMIMLDPLPSNRKHLSCGDCLEGKRGDYLTSSVLLCIIIVHIICTPT